MVQFVSSCIKMMMMISSQLSQESLKYFIANLSIYRFLEKAFVIGHQHQILKMKRNNFQID